MKQEPIKTRSFVRVGEEWRDTATLTPAQKRTLANWIKCTMLNAQFEGVAVFTPKEPSAGLPA